MKIFIQVDADPDDVTGLLFGSLRQYDNPRYLKWDSLTSNINTFEKFGERMRDRGLGFKATFFLRADAQIKALYGAYSEIFSRFYDRVKESFTVGWHPHLFRWSDSLKCWYQESQDDRWIRGILTESYDNLQSNGFQAVYSKMGWFFHNNCSMRTLSDLGVNADFSAVPGARVPGHLINGVSFQILFNWSKTKPLPYYPNEHDYQSSGDLRILEVPSTTYQVRGLKECLYSIKLTLSSYRRRDFSYTPSHKRMVPLYLPSLIKFQNLQTFSELLVKGNRDYVTVYLHPGDLLNTKAQKVFEDFVLQLISVADRHGEKTLFVDASDMFRLYASRNQQELQNGKRNS